MKFYLKNEKVCVRVKLFGEEVRARLLANEWEEVKDVSSAQYIFVNTCGFLEYREEQHMTYINNIDVKENQTVVVFGCLPAVVPNKFNSNIILLGREISEFDKIFNLPIENPPVYKAIDKEMTFKQKSLYMLNKILKSKAIDYRIGKNNLFIIEVSKGCLGNCSYCSEKFTTKFKSKTIAHISTQVDKALELGYKLISFKSDDMSAFGKDNGERIEDLIKEIISKDGDFYICLPEFNPSGLNDELIKLLRSPKIAYITLPIQSASAAVLNKMRRYYDIDTVISQVKEIRAINPKIQINTHIIVGFNGETDEDFLKTLNVVKAGIFDRIKVFGYSERNKTEASMMPVETKLSKDIINKRKRIMERAVLKNSKSLVNLLLNAELI